MRAGLLLTSAVVAVALLSSCASSDELPSARLIEQSVLLSDGREVTCVVPTGSRQGGVSCDW